MLSPGAARYDEFGRIKKKFRGTEADRKAREEAALARLHGTSGSGVGALNSCLQQSFYCALVMPGS